MYLPVTISVFNACSSPCDSFSLISALSFWAFSSSSFLDSAFPCALFERWLTYLLTVSSRLYLFPPFAFSVSMMPSSLSCCILLSVSPNSLDTCAPVQCITSFNALPSKACSSYITQKDTLHFCKAP